MLFWTIFGTAAFTTLVVSWGMAILFGTNSQKQREAIRKKGFCPECGAPLPPKTKPKPKARIGFKQ
jgi:hypothetical protein